MPTTTKTNKYLRACVALGLLVTPTLQHGMLVSPPPRTSSSSWTARHPLPKVCQNATEGFTPSAGNQAPSYQAATCQWANKSGHYWYSDGCRIGCECEGPRITDDVPKCKTPLAPTLNDPKLRTYMDMNITVPVSDDPKNKTTQTVNLNDIFNLEQNPWRAPGHAKIVNPCGVMGGADDTQNPGHAIFSNGGFAPDKSGGTKGTAMPPNGQKPTVWKAGSTVEVAWSFLANHGGGYLYRLCRKQPGVAAPTEACFDRHPLQPAPHRRQWIQTGDDAASRVAIDAVHVSEKLNGVRVRPLGSTWIRNPIPACWTKDSVGLDIPCQFERPAAISQALIPDNITFVPGIQIKNLSIVDELQLPAHLPSGEYWLNWRWDCEQSAQVWENCADVVIEAAAAAGDGSGSAGGSLRGGRI